MTPSPFSKLSRDDYTHESTYAQTRRSLHQATSLIADAYRSPDFYTLEQEQVFGSSWVAVGYVEQIAEPGQAIVVEVAGQSVVITRDADNRIHAFYNVCRHRGAQLVAEDCQVKRFQCPYHGWQYSLAGDCLATPMFGECGERIGSRLDRHAIGLLPVRIETWGFLIFVNLDENAMPLADWLGDLPQRFAGYRLDQWRLARQQHYDIHANWKLICENFMEYYHLPWIHPELLQVSRMDDHYREQGPGFYTGMRTTPVSSNTDAGGWQGLPAMVGLSEFEASSGRFIGLFPNICLAVLPNHVFVLMLKPERVDFTLESAALLLPPDTVAPDESAVDDMMAFWNLVNQQDIHIVETVQRGLNNRAYRGGYLSDQFEEPIHRFQNMVIDRMVGNWTIIPAGDPVNTESPPQQAA